MEGAALCYLPQKQEHHDYDSGEIDVGGRYGHIGLVVDVVVVPAENSVGDGEQPLYPDVHDKQDKPRSTGG